VHLKTSIKPPIYNLIHEFFINMVFTMAYPNFKKGLKMAFGPLGVQIWRFNIYKCNIYRDSTVFILLLLYLFVVKFYIIYLLFVLFRHKKSHNFEINIHNLLFLIKISILIKSFKGQNLTVPPSSYYQCCKIDHVQRSS
jgi:hypothetical protein